MNDIIYSRRVTVEYQSPAVCDVEVSSSGFPTIIIPPIIKPAGFSGGNLLWNTETTIPRLEWPQFPGALCYTVYLADDPNNPFGTYHIVAECVPPLDGEQPPMGGNDDGEGDGPPIGGSLDTGDLGDFGYAYIEIILPTGELIWTGPPFGFGEPPVIEELICTPLTECAVPTDNIFCDDYWSFASTISAPEGSAEFNKFGDRFCAKATAVNGSSNSVAASAQNRVSTFTVEAGTIGPVRLDIAVSRSDFGDKYDARVSLICSNDSDGLDVVYERHFYETGVYSEELSFPVGGFSGIYFHIRVEAGSTSATGPVNGWIGATGNFSMAPIPAFLNTEQTATASFTISGVTDPDFLFCNAITGSETFTIPAGVFGGTTQEEADALAASSACGSANDWLGMAASANAGCVFNGGTFNPTVSCP